MPGIDRPKPLKMKSEHPNSYRLTWFCKKDKWELVENFTGDEETDKLFDLVTCPRCGDLAMVTKIFTGRKGPLK